MQRSVHIYDIFLFPLDQISAIPHILQWKPRNHFDLLTLLASCFSRRCCGWLRRGRSGWNLITMRYVLSAKCCTCNRICAIFKPTFCGLAWPNGSRCHLTFTESRALRDGHFNFGRDRDGMDIKTAVSVRDRSGWGFLGIFRDYQDTRPCPL